MRLSSGTLGLVMSRTTKAEVDHDKRRSHKGLSRGVLPADCRGADAWGPGSGVSRLVDEKDRTEFFPRWARSG